jgi:Tol biopolymer transport system component/DNA-binding winged helix-turn-helix (wHTH) protein
MKQPISKPAKRFYSFGRYRLYAADRELFRGSEPVALPPKALEALLLLVSHHGHIVAKDRLIKELWPDTFVEETSLGFQIFQLRKTLGGGPDGKAYIETIPKRGYRFTAEVTESWEEARGLESRWPSLEQTEPTPVAGLSRWFRWVVAAAVLLAIGAGVAGYLLFLRPRTIPAKGQVRLVPLTTLPGSEMYPAFSPNGDQVAFAWNGNICVKLLDAGQPLRLTTGAAEDMGPAWSPDGRRIASSRWFQQDAAIYSIPALGGPERKLADLKCGKGFRHPLFSSLSWSPDGEFLAFGDKESPADRFHIFLLSIETGEKRSLPVASPGFLDHVYPVFSPDGRSPAFIGMNAIDSADLYVAPVSGGEPRRLTFDGRGMWGLAWTPDSQEIVFSSYRTGELSLWRVSPFGGTPKPVVGSGIASEFPAVSPRGDRLVFTRHITDTNIWRLGLRGAGRNGSATKLIESTYADENPQYSPDEKRIRFEKRLGSSALAISRDGRWLLYSQIDQYGDDLMLVENFR